MTDKGKKLDINGFIKRHSEDRKQKQASKREVTFQEYLKLLEEDPLIAQNSPSRILEMILDYGTKAVAESEKFSGAKTNYELFSKSLYGLAKPIENVIEHLKVGARSLSTGKQILLLVGPPASGKSTFVSVLKHALERYQKRSVFMIKGCPIREEPLHLLPRSGGIREEISKKLGIKIEGDLCPVCRHNLRTNFKDKDGTVRWWEVPVETFTFSIQGTRGIGSFEPSDEKTTDVSQLVGKENIAVSSTKGPDHPEAYAIGSGELGKANRGLFEGRELIKSPEELLWVFISVAEEKEIKIQGSAFPHISVDETLVGHTNLNEYKKFTSNPANEALHDRIYVIFFPYPLQLQDEMKIYKKLIEEEGDWQHLKKCHIAPGSLEIAALFAIMTRLTVSKMAEIDVLTKAKIYNGDKALTEICDKNDSPLDIRNIIQEGQNETDPSQSEGMFGMSSRDVLAALNNAIVKYGNGCLTPLKTIEALRDVFSHRMGYSPEEIQKYKAFLSASEGDSVIAEYEDFVKTSVTRAFLRSHKDMIKENFKKYVEQAMLYRRTKSQYLSGQVSEIERDALTGELKESDERFMRSIEEHIPVDEKEADAFRAGILEAKAVIGEKNFGPETYPRLTRAVEAMLIASCQSSITLVLDEDRPKSIEDKHRMNEIMEGLKDAKFCDECAKEALKQARELFTE